MRSCWYKCMPPSHQLKWFKETLKYGCILVVRCIWWMWLSQSNLLSALWSPTASAPAPTPLAAIISMERYFISCCWLFSPQSPQRLWSDTFFKSPERACGLAVSAHHRLQTAADTHSAAALIKKKSAAFKVSQSKSGSLRSSSRFSGEAAVLIFPAPRRGELGGLKSGEDKAAYGWAMEAVVA